MRVMLCRSPEYTADVSVSDYYLGDLEPNSMTRIPRGRRRQRRKHKVKTHIGHGSPVVYSIDELSRAVGTRGCDCAMEAQLVYWGATLIPRGVLGGLETVHVLPTSHIRCMCDVLSERGDECCAVTGVSKLSFVCLTDLTIASASSGASMDARYHLGASGIF